MPVLKVKKNGVWEEMLGSATSHTHEVNDISNFLDVVDSSLSSTSTNPIQNKVVSTEIDGLKTLVNTEINDVNTEIDGLKTLVGDTSVSSQISTALSNVQLAVTTDGVLTVSE